MLALAFGLFGLIIGSFLNVIILRYPEKSLGGRSECPYCHHTIFWYDNIPVISWFVLGGRCRHCRARISIQYPLVEAAMGILFAFIGAAPGINLFIAGMSCAMAALLVAIAVYDFYHTIIPNAWVYPFILLALAYGLLTLGQGALLFSIAAGPIVALPLFALWFFSRGLAMGFGDVKLALGIGWLLGPTFGLAALALGFVIGGVVSAPLLLLSSQWWERTQARFTPTAASRSHAWGFTMKSEIAFGPFLVCSCIIVWLSTLYGIDLFALIGLSP